jgi:hypothetical protein
MTADCDKSFAVINNRRTACRVRRWATGFGLATGAAVAAAVIGAAAARADDADELLGQAGSDLTQANQLLDQVAATSLDAEQASFLDRQEMIQTGPASDLLSTAQTFQDGLPAADQTSPLLLDVDQQLAQAYAGLLDADQGFLAAAQAGDLSQGATAFSTDFSLIDANLATLGADLDVTATDFVAMFDSAILTAF